MIQTEEIIKHKFSTKSTEVFPLTVGQIEVLEQHKINMLNLSVEHEIYFVFQNRKQFFYEAVNIQKHLNNINK